MAQVRKDRVQVEVEINGKKVTNTLNDIRKAYGLANKELKGLTRGSEEFVNKQKEVAQLKQILDDQRASVEEYQQALDNISPRSILGLTRQSRALKGELEGLVPGTEEFLLKAAELQSVEAELAAAKREAGLLGKNLEDLDPKSLAALQEKAKGLRAELSKLDPQTKEYKKKLKELGSTEKELGKVQKGLKGAGEGGNFMLSSFRKVNSFLKGSLIGLLLSIGAGFIQAIRSSVEVVGQFQNIREEINRVSGETGDQLEASISKTKALADTFDVDVNEAIKSTNAAARAFNQGYGETVEQLQKGLLVVGNQGDEFLEQIKEYSPQLKQAGLTAEQSFAVVANAINQGVFNDSGAAAIEEFNLRIKNLSAGQRDLLEETFGKNFADKIADGVETGKVSSVQALAEISGKVGELGADSADAQKIISELYGSGGEKAGADFIISLQNVGTELEDLIDSSNVYTQRQQELLELEEETAAAQANLSRELDGVGNFFSKAGNKLQTGFFVGLTRLVRFLRTIPDQWRIFRVRSLEQINGLVERANKAINFLLSPLKALFEVLGQDFPEVKVPAIQIDTSSVELQRQLQEKIRNERKAFEESQKREALAAQQAEAAALRREQLKNAAEEEKRRQEKLARLYEEERKTRQQALQNLEALQIDLIEDQNEREIARLQQAAESKIQKLEGSEKLIADQTLAIRQKLALDIEAVEAEAFQQNLARKQAQARIEIAGLEGSAADVKAARQQIETDLFESLQRTEESYIQQRIQRIQENAESEISLLQGSAEEIAEERKRITSERDQEINQLQAESITSRLEDIQQEYEVKLAAVADGEGDISQARADLQRQRDLQIKEIQEAAIQGEILLDETRKQQLQSSDEAAYQKRLGILVQSNEQRKLEITKALIEEEETGQLKEDFDQALQDRLLAQQKAFLENRLAIEKEFGQDGLRTQQEIEQLKLEATRGRIDSEIEAEKKKKDELQRLDEERKARRQEVISNTVTLFESLKSITASISEKQLDELDARRQQELEAAGENAAQKAEIEKRYEEEKEKLQERGERKRKLISIGNKILAGKDVVIETAKSISKTGADLGYPAAIPFQIYAGIVGAAQLATIAAQKFKDGGKAPKRSLSPTLLPALGKGGLASGSSHENGGIKLLDRGKIVGEIEGGEPILSVATYKNNREIVDKLLYTSMHKGGAAIYRDGGILTAPTTTPAQEVIEKTAEFSDQRMVTEIRKLQKITASLELRIGEKQANEIADLAGNYRNRVSMGI